MSPPDIVLVEDNPADAELTLLALVDGRPSLAIEVLHDGQEALDRLLPMARHGERPADALPRLVLLDIKLPKVGGLEVLRALKGEPAMRVVPVVMLTSSNVERDVAACLEAGANSYVQKPVAFDDLRRVLVAVRDYWLDVHERAPDGMSRGDLR